MYIIIGGTGHVGSQMARALLDAGEPVTIVTRDARRARGWRAAGAALAQADIRDVEALRAVLRRGRRAFLLNPPAAPDTDTDAEERANLAALIAALDGSGLEMVVAQSTWGARPGTACGDLTVLWGMEQALSAQPIPARIIRAAWHMSNWDGSIADARERGRIETPLPADLPLPMVAPADIGAACAAALRGPVGRSLDWIEGPARVSPAEVAAALARLLGRGVVADAVHRDGWIDWFRGAGFSEPAARSYACMTAVTADRAWEEPEAPIRGTTTIAAYLATRLAPAT